MAKEWSCNNQCKSNCCSEIFLELSPEQREQFERDETFIQEKDEVEKLEGLDFYRWLRFHEQFAVQNMLDGRKKIIFKGKIFDIKYNPFLSKDLLYVDDPCQKLNDDYFCTVYGNRPKMCKLAKCPVFDASVRIRWFAKHGKLKSVVKTAGKS